MDGKTYEVKMNDLYEAILQLEKENAELRKRTEWQPMETAPLYKDVLLKFGDFVFVGYVERILGSLQITHPRTLDYLPPDDFDGWKEVE